MAGKIQVFKLVTGEDIIGKIDDAEADGLLCGKTEAITIQNPVNLLVRRSEEMPDEFQLAMTPWVAFSSTGKVPIFPNQIVSVYDPNDGIAIDYEETYGDESSMVSFTSARDLLTENVH